MSFNDKIRYLFYEKKVFDKTINSYVQTLRTIGNRGVHEDGRNISELKLWCSGTFFFCIMVHFWVALDTIFFILKKRVKKWSHL